VQFFYQILECQDPLHKSKAFLLKTSGQRFWLSTYLTNKHKQLSVWMQKSHGNPDKVSF